MLTAENQKFMLGALTVQLSELSAKFKSLKTQVSYSLVTKLNKQFTWSQNTHSRVFSYNQITQQTVELEINHPEHRTAKTKSPSKQFSYSQFIQQTQFSLSQVTHWTVQLESTHPIDYSAEVKSPSGHSVRIKSSSRQFRYNQVNLCTVQLNLITQ